MATNEKPAAAQEPGLSFLESNASPTPTLAKNTASDPDLVDAPVKPTGATFWLIMVSLWLVTFLICLDITIISPAIPAITNDFQDTSKATWFYSVYLATNTSFQPTFGPFIKVQPKWSFLISTFLFEIGSLICAVANDSNLFIFGRALAGFAAAGTYVGVFAALASIVEPHEMTKWSNSVGSIYALGAIMGPIWGGAFTTRVSWRWCFYINLPLGGVALVTSFIFLRQPKNPHWKRELLDVVKKTDWVGLILVLGSLMQILMVFQWGGLQYSWSSSRIIGLIVGSILSALAAAAWCAFKGEHGYLKPRLLKQSVVWTGALHNFALAGDYLTVISVLSFYYQIRGSSALRSGVQLLPLIAGVILAMIVGGGLAPKIGYPTPLLYAGELCLVLGTGIIVLFDLHTSTAYWAGITFLTGFGSGLCWMMPFVAVQAVLGDGDREEGALLCALIQKQQTLGGAIIFGVGQSIYLNKYASALNKIPGLPNAEAVAKAGVTAFFQVAPPEFIPQVQKAAIDSLHNAYYMPIAVLGLTMIALAPFTPWPSIKPPEPASPAQDSETVAKLA